MRFPSVLVAVIVALTACTLPSSAFADAESICKSARERGGVTPAMEAMRFVLVLPQSRTTVNGHLIACGAAFRGALACFVEKASGEERLLEVRLEADDSKFLPPALARTAVEELPVIATFVMKTDDKGPFAELKETRMGDGVAPPAGSSPTHHVMCLFMAADCAPKQSDAEDGVQSKRPP